MDRRIEAEEVLAVMRRIRKVCEDVEPDLLTAACATLASFVIEKTVPTLEGRRECVRAVKKLLDNRIG